ncbi:MAG: transcriptional regulator [Candidatus Marinimicrobia bacterium]|nr:transcriptional regulator [Candidatus Neomarinimicrobiota bacterium]
MDKFLARHSVFTINELDDFLLQRGTTKISARNSVLRHHKGAGRIKLIRRGLYAVIPTGANPDTYQVDPYLIASKLKPDAVLAYHTALEFHGNAYSVYSRFTYTSSERSAPLKYQSSEYLRVPIPTAFRKKAPDSAGVKTIIRSGGSVQVTNLERTLVDVLHRPDLSGSWEEIWRSLGSVEYFDTEQVIKYVKALKNATIAAKVGFFLDQHRDTLLLDDSYLTPLQRLVPKQPHYLERGNRKDCKLIKDWNLMVPHKILDRDWEEPS